MIPCYIAFIPKPWYICTTALVTVSIGFPIKLTYLQKCFTVKLFCYIDYTSLFLSCMCLFWLSLRLLSNMLSWAHADFIVDHLYLLDVPMLDSNNFLSDFSNFVLFGTYVWRNVHAHNLHCAHWVGVYLWESQNFSSRFLFTWHPSWVHDPFHNISC